MIRLESDSSLRVSPGRDNSVYVGTRFGRLSAVSLGDFFSYRNSPVTQRFRVTSRLKEFSGKFVNNSKVDRVAKLMSNKTNKYPLDCGEFVF